MGRFRHPTRLRRLLAALAVVALGLKLLFPAGFMPGTSLAQPIVLCDGQGPMATMPGMAHHHAPDAQHAAGDHACPFAAAGIAPPTPDTATPVARLVATEAAPLADRLLAVAPGHGLAAPPPPSHAPPRRRA